MKAHELPQYTAILKCPKNLFIRHNNTKKCTLAFALQTAHRNLPASGLRIYPKCFMDRAFGSGSRCRWSSTVAHSTLFTPFYFPAAAPQFNFANLAKCRSDADSPQSSAPSKAKILFDQAGYVTFLHSITKPSVVWNILASVPPRHHPHMITCTCSWLIVSLLCLHILLCLSGILMNFYMCFHCE